MLFPINQDQNNLAVIEKNNIENKFGKSFLFDFEQGDFVFLDGKIQCVEGIEALKMWIKKVLKTEKFKYEIYEIMDNEYGIKLTNYISSNLPMGVIYAGIQEGITEMLSTHPDITVVTSFEFTREKKSLKVAFVVISTYGEISEGVTL